MEKFFKLKEHGTNVGTEVVAGITTFFAMAYIIFVNPQMLGITGMPTGAVFLATIFASVAGTLVMGLFANVPYAQAPGMGLNAFFTYTVCGALGFSWQQALAMVFLCGMINVLITITKIRKMIIKSIPESIQHAISGGIGIFIAYIGIKNAGLLSFTSDPGTYMQFGENGTVVASSSAVPGLVTFNSAGVILALIGIVITIALLIMQVKGAIIIGIVATTLVGIPMGIVDLAAVGTTTGLATSFGELKQTLFVAFGSKGLLSLFSDSAKIPLVLMTIFAFSLSDTFDTIGTFIGTGRRAGIFSAEDENALESGSGLKSKMDKALFADSVATSVGAIFGTSNTTTYVESAAGIGAGGRTGLTSVVTAVFFLLSMFLAPIIGIVPAQATAPALIVVGIMMMSSFKEVEWNDLEEAVPAFFASIFMGLCYSISYGIAFGFAAYCLVKVCKGKIKEVHPVIWVATGLFMLNFAILAVL
ncbi:NCS2 family permease [Anaerobium acetethylicum]|uniref:Putative MFS transporter, AGZA family, xanthine/uracil permease n=1 Tax=Anaerobium acetethylicum TaxID=1619234 RepID=A0A1D3TPS5_9FIRM|nr:NCS2 family permease [Anaerobium acetethylicum]SCP95422.1 putative MFS transporter, AGZA family, xanthine/uracil permease [Anaerobium acetethylicum]